MAFHALYKWFRKFRKSMYPCNPIADYKHQLYNEWYESLTPEQQRKQDEFLRKQTEKRIRRQTARMACVSNILSTYARPYMDTFNKIW